MKWIHEWAASAPSPSHPERNEDQWWISANHQAAAVIDGMGGYRRQTPNGEIGGEHAATLARDVIRDHLDDWSATITLAESKTKLRAIVEAVNQAIWEQLNHAGVIPADENSEEKPLEELTVGVALTIMVLCDDGKRAVAAQQGDTHGYVLKEDLGLVQITEDQDLLMWERMNGLLTEEESSEINAAIDAFDGVTVESLPSQKVLRYFYDKNIFGALGVDGNCPDTGWAVIKLIPNDRLVFLSDGAYSNCTLNELNGLAWLDNDPAAAIVDLAQQRSVMQRLPNPLNPDQSYNMRATQDDMTAVVVTIGEAAPHTDDVTAEATVGETATDADVPDTTDPDPSLTDSTTEEMTIAE